MCRILDRLFLTRPLPETLILDNGPEFAGTALDAWAAQHGVHLHCIQPGNPVQHAFIERFNGTTVAEFSICTFSAPSARCASAPRRGSTTTTTRSRTSH